MTLPYPSSAKARSAAIVARRPARNPLNPRKPVGVTVELELAASGSLLQVCTIFLTNRECPWHCLMCDLWKNTLTESVAPGDIPAQLDHAFGQLGLSSASAGEPIAPDPRRNPDGVPAQIKLYNSGSFFDPGAIPVCDYETIARRLQGFDHVIVECHPALVGKRCLQFRNLLSKDRSNFRPTLEVAMGLETVNPTALARLNKGMTLEQFRDAAAFLREHEIMLRAFILIQPPHISASEAVEWSDRSVEFAFACGASVVSLIPTRTGNGAIDALIETGEFTPPAFQTVEAAFASALRHRDEMAGRRRSSRSGRRVFLDLWELDRFSECPECFPQRLLRLREMNHTQKILPEIRCSRCQAHP